MVPMHPAAAWVGAGDAVLAVPLAIGRGGLPVPAIAAEITRLPGATAKARRPLQTLPGRSLWVGRLAETLKPECRLPCLGVCDPLALPSESGVAPLSLATMSLAPLVPAASWLPPGLVGVSGWQHGGERCAGGAGRREQFARGFVPSSSLGILCFRSLAACPAALQVRIFVRKGEQKSCFEYPRGSVVRKPMRRP